MIYMRVGQEEKIDLGRPDRPLLHGHDRIIPLGRAAVHQDIQTPCPEQMTGACHCILSAERT